MWDETEVNYEVDFPVLDTSKIPFELGRQRVEEMAFRQAQQGEEEPLWNDTQMEQQECENA